MFYFKAEDGVREDVVTGVRERESAREREGEREREREREREGE